MSKIIVDSLQANPGQELIIQGDLNLVGSFNQEVSSINLLGNSLEGETAVLNYGINVIESGDVDNYVAKLPSQLKLGGTVGIINNSNISMVVYPSFEGGSIDGSQVGGYVIPPDNKIYSFTCSSTGSSGKWSGPSVPALPNYGLYDSGEITFDNPAGCEGDINWASSSDPSRVVISGAHYSQAIWGYDGLNKPQFIYVPSPLTCARYVAWKPSRPWAQITKVTVFTNMTVNTSQRFGIAFGSHLNYYNAGCTTTGCLYQATNPAFGGFGSPTYVTLSNQLAGTPVTTGTTTGSTSGFTLTTGEPGTYWGELIYSASTRPLQIGDVFLGTVNYGPAPNPKHLWKSTYINTAFQPRIIGNGIKFRFLIEYITYPPTTVSPL